MRIATYSRNVFIPVTDLCRNQCGYCSFRHDVGKARVIARHEAIALLDQGSLAGCKEALFSLGEKPWDVPGFEALALKSGVFDLLDYLIELSELALERGLLPHTNAGALEEECLSRLKPYNASMGMMLETSALVEAHALSPGKRLEERLSCLKAAGRLKIPFTTGILVGIGESREDRASSLRIISSLRSEHGHIQEVIIQPFDPKPGTAMASYPPPEEAELLETVRLAREMLPPEVAIQVPPNLVQPRPLLDAGASDLGGISPVTPDWINPGRPWPKLGEMGQGYKLLERLPIYPRYLLSGWCGERASRLAMRLAGKDGLALRD